MVQTVMLNRTNKNGVTLVEVLISLVVLLIVFMGLLQTSLLSIEGNAITLLRDEAVKLASDTMTALRTSPFDDLNRNQASASSDYSGDGDVTVEIPNSRYRFQIESPVTGAAPANAAQRNARNLGIQTRRTMRNILNANYLIRVTTESIDADNKRVTILVQWDWKDRTRAGLNPYSHTIVALLRRP
jgi:prepilin-type N-terminal cleavage/methylation domain-containing protein